MMTKTKRTDNIYISLPVSRSDKAGFDLRYPNCFRQFCDNAISWALADSSFFESVFFYKNN